MLITVVVGGVTTTRPALACAKLFQPEVGYFACPTIVQ
jgi:hypothetical protein